MRHSAISRCWRVVHNQIVLMACFSALKSLLPSLCRPRPTPSNSATKLGSQHPRQRLQAARVCMRLAVHFWCCLSIIRDLDCCLTEMKVLRHCLQVTAPYNVSSSSGKQSGKTANATRTAPPASPPYNMQQQQQASPPLPPAAPAESPSPQAAAPAKVPAKSTSATSMGELLWCLLIKKHPAACIEHD